MTLKAWQAITTILLVTGVTLLTQIPSDTWATAAAGSLVAGAAALSCMASACVLSSRWRSVERLFGGLDRVYNAHKWLGIWALVFAVVHFVFKPKLDAWDMAPILAMSDYWTRLVRQLSLVALGLIVLLALNRNIPYRVWRWWHKLSGPLFLIVVLHGLSIKSPITLASPPGIWLTLIGTAGVIAALYKLFLYAFVAPGADYRVASIVKATGAMHLELEPVQRGFPFEAGQFGFLAIKADGLREPHPFTIANAPSVGGNIHFVIRSLGDYTHKLHDQLRVGMLADVHAPYGRFNRQPGAERELWIGAGVGISPFISWLHDTTIGSFGRATLIYCFDPARAFPSVERMQALTDASGVRFVPNPSGGEALASTIRQAATEVDPKQVHISFCGPNGLLKRVQELMRQHSIPAKNLRHEFFEFR